MVRRSVLSLYIFISPVVLNWHLTDADEGIGVLQYKNIFFTAEYCTTSVINIAYAGNIVHKF